MNATPVIPNGQWRSLDQFERWIDAETSDEFSAGSSEAPDGYARREFLRIMAASLALAGAACTRQPRETIVPRIRQPEQLVTGQPLWFATAMGIGGTAHGLLVRSDEGRPTKIEGNPDHPETLGRSSVHAQAALLSLYDPDRSQTLRQGGQASTWEDFLGDLQNRLPAWKAKRGKGLRLLTDHISSPTLLAQISAWLSEFPEAQWHVYDAAFPVSAVRPRCHFDRTQVVLSLDADFLGNPCTPPRDVMTFTRKRREANEAHRLYVIESTPSLTGAMADHRRALRPTEIEALAQSLERGAAGASVGLDEWGRAVLAELQRYRGSGLVLAGDFQPAAVHEAARALNDAFGNTGVTIEYESSQTAPPRAGNLPELAAAMMRGEVEALVILEVNPAFTTPVDLEFAAGMKRVPLTIHHGLYLDETARRCAWHVPASHFLEEWSDVRTAESVEAIVQPLIEPLYATKSAHEFLAALMGRIPADGYEIVRAAWQERIGAENFEREWRQVLHDGWRAGHAPGNAPLRVTSVMTAAREGSPEGAAKGTLELIIRPDPHVLDGRFANNGWLQELPKPLTKLTWENAALLSAQTAKQFGLAHGDVVELHYRGNRIEAPAYVLPGHADGAITVHLGYGRESAGRVGNGLGFNAALLQTSDAPWGGKGLEVRKTGRQHVFATTQEHQQMEGRDLVHVQSADGEPLMGLNTPQGSPRENESLYPLQHYGRPAWGMVIDLDACTGCGTCTISCQAENNIPVVGREQVLRGREMHWIRVDRYFEGAPDAPRVLHQPVPCMHCENAPCEAVCPVAATVHDHSGLNLMVYNRCIGTRYCSNNCPYKVRRFNFLQYVDRETPQLALQRNPDVTVRMRGVMEKCTYCIQRISAAQIAADKESRAIRDGEVTPACAQACPANAIGFGDILDDASRVASLRKSSRHYSLLAELNTRPRTTYLAKVSRPNPEVPA